MKGETMTKQNEEVSKEIYIDWKSLALTLLKKAWIMLIVGALLAAFAVVYFKFFVTPKYASGVMLYVNNKTHDDTSISASDLSASQSLIDTYIVILKNRTTMEQIRKKSGVEYSYSELMSMISTKKVDGTEVFEVTVTSENPEEAAHIANCIAEVLKVRIAEIADGSSLRVVDGAIVNKSPVSPGVVGEAVKAFLLGFVVVAVIVAFLFIIDDTITTDDYVTTTYDLPILTVVPDFGVKSKSYSSYYKNAYGGKDASGAERGASDV